MTSEVTDPRVLFFMFVLLNLRLIPTVSKHIRIHKDLSNLHLALVKQKFKREGTFDPFWGPQ